MDSGRFENLDKVVVRKTIRQESWKQHARLLVAGSLIALVRKKIHPRSVFSAENAVLDIFLPHCQFSKTIEYIPKILESRGIDRMVYITFAFYGWVGYSQVKNELALIMAKDDASLKKLLEQGKNLEAMNQLGYSLSDIEESWREEKNSILSGIEEELILNKISEALQE